MRDKYNSVTQHHLCVHVNEILCKLYLTYVLHNVISKTKNLFYFIYSLGMFGKKN